MAESEKQQTDQAKLAAYVEEYATERSSIEVKLNELSKLFSNIYELSRDKHKLYEYRQKLVSRKYELMTNSNVINKTVVQKKRQIYDGYKLGKGTTSQVMPKNDFEREMYLNDDLKSTNLMVSLIDGQIGLIVDSIKTLDNMIFGVQYAIELEKFKAPLVV